LALAEALEQLEIEEMRETATMEAVRRIIDCGQEAQEGVPGLVKNWRMICTLIGG
jgi:hypothetical protein